MNRAWFAAALVLLAGCITSLRDLGEGSVDKEPVDSPVFTATPNVMFETCAKVFEEEDYKVTKADRKSGIIEGEVISPSSFDREGTRVLARMRLEKKGTGSIVHLTAIKEINKNIEDPMNVKEAKWQELERATDAEIKLIFKLRHKLGDDAKEAAEDFRRRNEKPSQAKIEMTEPLETDRWEESCPFHADPPTVWSAVKGALAQYGIQGEDRKSGQMETPWMERQGVNGHWVRRKVIVRVEPTRYDVIVKLMVRQEMTAEPVHPKGGGKATWESIGYDLEMQRDILLKLTMQLKG
ncbi:MAG: hypothetical protein AAB434_05620 [Planctomycetota bacterium]